MRTSLTISTLLHLALLVWLFVTLPSTKIESTESVPVDVISADELSHIMAGSKNGQKSDAPKPIVDKLHDELTTVAAMPDIRALTIKLGAIPVDSPAPAALQTFLASEIDRWGNIIERAGVAQSQ